MPRTLAASLRARLLLLVLLAVIPALGLVLYSAMEQRRAMAERVQQGVLSLTRVVAHEHQVAIAEGRMLLGGLVRLPALRRQVPEECDELLAAVQEGSSRYLNLGVLDARDGSVICSAQAIPAGIRPSAVVMAAVKEAARTRGFVISSYAVGQVSKRPLLIFAQAIGGQGTETHRVLYASLSLDWLNHMAANARLPEGSTLTVVDPHGVVLARYPDASRWVGQSVAGTGELSQLLLSSGSRTFRTRGLDGFQRLYASSPLVYDAEKVFGHLAIGVPVAEAYAAAGARLRRDLLWLALIAALALAAAWFGGSWLMIRPIQALLGATRRLQVGERGARSEVPHGPGELEQLAQAFDEMAAALQAREEEAERSAESLRRQALVFDTLLEGVLVTDAEHRIIDWNPGAEHLFGYTREEMLGRVPSELHPMRLNGRLGAEIVAALESTGRWSGDVCFVRKDGSEGVSEAVLVAQHDEQGRRIAHVAVHRDITERRLAEEALRQSEEQLRQAQKMEAVGRLAGGIAHDFNNLLTAITGNVEMAMLELPASNPVRSDLEEAQKAAETAASLTRQLLAFTRRQSAEPQVLRLNTVIDSTTRLLQRLIGAEVELITQLEPVLWPVRADSGQIEQVLMNLAVNARDAMPQGGRLVIEARNVELDEEHPRRRSYVPPGEYVWLTVSDTGHGMDEETRERIFEPFFTTKEQGKGTGLGLFTVYGIVRQSGGYIWAESGPAAGTSFQLLFPRAPVEADQGGTAPTRDSLPGGGETILLVEDEAPVRLLTQRLLERIGYRVVTAEDGEHALQVSAQHEGPIDLMLTDLTMPRMGGLELADRMAELRPDMPVVFMSGYTQETVPLRQGNGSASAFIHKPFTLSTLASTVRTTLDTVQRIG